MDRYFSRFCNEQRRLICIMLNDLVKIEANIRILGLRKCRKNVALLQRTKAMVSKTQKGHELTNGLRRKMR